jgi:outer membrane protein TolC
MNSAINLKSVVCKLWLALLMGALIQVSLLDVVHAQSATKAQAAKKPTKSKSQESNLTATKAPGLALDEFVGQVRSGNGAFKGSEEASQGASLRSDEYKLLTRPTLVGDASYKDDRAETGSPVTGNINRTQSYSLGVKQVTSFGLEGSLTYRLVQTAIPQSTFINPNNFWAAGPVLELKQSLWRNGFGRETRANQQRDSAQALVVKYRNSFQQKQMISGAETTYWRLALAREAVDLAKENLQRADRLRGWSSGRQRSGLGDRSDSLQASTAYLARELDLRKALNEEKAASRAFNTIRGVDSDVVDETLTAFTGDVIDARMRLPDRSDVRDDVKAAEQESRLAEAQAKLGAEKSRPLVDVYGAIGYNGRDVQRSETTRESWTDENPTYLVGVKLAVPLDVGTASDNVKGYKAEARAAKMTYDYRKFESERLWKDLSVGLQDSLAQYKLAAEIEKVSREKMEYERVRHGRGRTTTFQVIQFETDYASAQLNRIRTQFDILNQYANLRTFAGGSQ